MFLNPQPMEHFETYTPAPHLYRRSLPSLSFLTSLLLFDSFKCCPSCLNDSCSILPRNHTSRQKTTNQSHKGGESKKPKAAKAAKKVTYTWKTKSRETQTPKSQKPRKQETKKQRKVDTKQRRSTENPKNNQDAKETKNTNEETQTTQTQQPRTKTPSTQETLKPRNLHQETRKPRNTKTKRPETKPTNEPSFVPK